MSHLFESDEKKRDVFHLPERVWSTKNLITLVLVRQLLSLYPLSCILPSFRGLDVGNLGIHGQLLARPAFRQP